MFMKSECLSLKEEPAAAQAAASFVSTGFGWLTPDHVPSWNMLFWLISSPLVATLPAVAALTGLLDFSRFVPVHKYLRRGMESSE